jgi:hypothetical protein
MSDETGSGTVRRPRAAAGATVRRARKVALASNAAGSPGENTAPATAVESIPVPALEIPVGAGAQPVQAKTVTITQGGAGEVEAESISVTQGGIGAASAEDITISMGGIGRAQADDIAVRMGGIGVARGDRVSVELGGVGLAIGNSVSVTQGFARSVLAREVSISQGAARSIVAQNVSIEGEAGTFLLLARRVDGNVRTVLDWRGALVAGAALGVVMGLLARRRHG